MYYLKFIYKYIPLYLVVLNLYEQSDFFRSELKSFQNFQRKNLQVIFSS